MMAAGSPHEASFLICISWARSVTGFLLCLLSVSQSDHTCWNRFVSSSGGIKTLVVFFSFFSFFFFLTFLFVDTGWTPAGHRLDIRLDILAFVPLIGCVIADSYH